MGFFDKLKMGMETEPIPSKPAAKTASGKGRPKSAKLKIKPAVEKIEEETAKEVLEKPKQKEPDFEGELAIDVYETDGDYVIQSTIAGVKAEDLDITIENGIVTIKGNRQKQTTEDTKKYYYQECYWGSFSRQVMLPEEVDGSKAEAAIKEGVLTLRIPKLAKVQKRKISIRQAE